MRRARWLPVIAPAAGDEFVRAWVLPRSRAVPVTVQRGESERWGAKGGDSESIEGAIEPDPALQLDDAMEEAGEGAGGGAGEEAPGTFNAAEAPKIEV